jgi:hypothetical protein
MSYYVQHNGQQLGPFTEAEVKAQLAAGAVAPTDYVWWEGQKEWTPLNTTLLANPAVPTAAVVPGTPAAAAYQPPSAAGGSSQLAMWALISGCAGFLCGFPASITAIILGHMALNEIKKKPGLEGRGMAVAGLVLGYVITVFALLVVIIYICLFGVFAAANLKSS